MKGNKLQVVQIMRIWLLLIAMCLFLVGCSEAKDLAERPVYPTSFSMEADDFLYELEVNDGRFSGEEPVITAALTYIGNKEEIVITHAFSPFYFDLKETTRGYEMDYFMNQLLVYTTLKKDEPLTEQYITSGGYSDTDAEEYRQFMQEFLNDSYPDGEYVVHGYARFQIEDEAQNTELGGHIGFTVE